MIDEPDELTALQMENNLLELQSRILRAENAAVEDRLQALRDEMQAEIDAIPQTPIGPDQAIISSDELEELRLARGQLRWLIKRLGGSIAGPILRRWSGWRTVEERWR